MNFVAELIRAGQGSTRYVSVPAAISDVVNRMLAALEQVKNARLGKPLHGSGRNSWPQSVEAWRSGHSLANFLSTRLMKPFKTREVRRVIQQVLETR